MRLRHALPTVLLGALPAVVVAATPAHALTCPIVADPAGDAGYFAARSVLASTNADIRSVDVGSGATNVVAVMRVTSLAPETASNLGTGWNVGWTINGNRYAAQARRGAGPNAAYIWSFSGAAPVAFSVDVPNATLTWTVPRSALPDLATPGATFTDFAATTTLLSSTADVAFDASATYVDQSAGCIPAS